MAVLTLRKPNILSFLIRGSDHFDLTVKRVNFYTLENRPIYLFNQPYIEIRSSSVSIDQLRWRFAGKQTKDSFFFFLRPFEVAVWG